MRTKSIFCVLIIATCLFSCKSKPSKEDISKKILMEYVCAENAKINSLNIISSQETKTFLGGPAIQYLVSGQVEWPQGCDEGFGSIRAGTTESFENKTVILAKGDDGWQ